jgi:hypothetical protein
MSYNLDAPNGLVEPCDLTNMSRWFVRESLQVEAEPMREVLRQVAGNLNDFIRWPTRAVLLWEGCDRIAPEGEERRYHRYPELIRKLAKEGRVTLDSRPNGPAIAAFRLSGGVRPERFGSSNAWSIHHVYSGKFPYLDRTATTHAIKECKHFTQSAGLVASHPIADALCDEFPFFAWLLRAESFHRFGYDPDGVFSPHRDGFGFSKGHGCVSVVAA